MKQLWTPWRMEYIKQKGKTADSCVFCALTDQAASAADEFVVAQSTYNFAVLNRYPYTYGHSMIVPFEHLSSQEDMTSDALTDLMTMVNRVMRVLREIADPPGFNIGANIGAAAGAGIASHYHFHIVPRWSGDANFLATIGETQTVADTLSCIAGQMRATWVELYGAV